MADAIILRDVVPARPPERWTRALSLSLPASAFIVIRTLPALSARLCSIVLGDEVPHQGSASILGQPIDTLSRARLRSFRTAIGSVLRPDGLVGNMTVWHNLALPLIFAEGMEEAKVVERVEEISSAFGLRDLVRTRPANLSPDKRQVVALARAVISRPSLLLLDEPLASVGTVETVSLMALCRRFVPTILAATHRRNAALYECADDVFLWDEEGLRPAAFSVEQRAS